MVWGTSTTTSAWGPQPAPLDPLLSQIRSGRTRTLVLFSSQRVRADDWPRLFDALADAERSGHGVTSISMSGQTVPVDAYSALETYLSVASSLTELACLPRDATDAELGPWARGFSSLSISALAKLDLSGKALGTEPTESKSQLATLLEAVEASLTSLSLAGTAPMLPASLAPPTGALTNLHTLDLSDCDLSPSALRAWIAAVGSLALRTLRLSGNPGLFPTDSSSSDEEELGSVLATYAPNLTSLTLSETPIPTGTALASVLAACPHLKTLDVSGAVADVLEFSPVEVREALTSLTLTGAGFTSVNAGAVMVAFPNLSHLDLSECRAGGASVAVVAAILGHGGSLRSLALRGVSLVGIVAAAAAEGAWERAGVTSLDLTATGLDLAELTALVTLLPTVTLWEVGANPCCDDVDGMMELTRTTAPRCEIVWRMMGQGDEGQEDE
ncbi:hypothetical protein BC828DRAFT_440556 [Blastocladiella britannica]|nr:hypothetical protein BC828DRAFT_440556 [Blastocladiella britannica]